MKHLILILLFLPLLSASQDSNQMILFSDTSLTYKERVQLIEVDTNFFNHWVLKKVMHPSEKGWKESNGGAYSNLFLLSSGVYMWQSGSNYESGTWRVKDNYLGFSPLEFNGRLNEKYKHSYRWRIREITPDTLIVSIQGRHGGHAYMYKPN